MLFWDVTDGLYPLHTVAQSIFKSIYNAKKASTHLEQAGVELDRTTLPTARCYEPFFPPAIPCPKGPCKDRSGGYNQFKTLDLRSTKGCT